LRRGKPVGLRTLELLLDLRRDRARRRAHAPAGSRL
jgi:hypothetical protein